MRLINKNSRRGIVNLFADFILSKIDKTNKSIIQVSDCGSFMVVNGLTTSETPLDLMDIKLEFIEKFDEQLKDLEYGQINVIDIIKYGQEINPISKVWFKTNKSPFVEEPEPISELSISSEFPYGYSLNCGRSAIYYSHYIFNHMFNLMNVDEVMFFYNTDIDESEDFKIKIVSDSKIDKERIKSLILDVFDFDLTSFEDRIKDYNLIEDILDPNGEKPYLKQDLLEHVILF